MIRPCWVPCQADKQHPTGRRTFDPERWEDAWLEQPDILETQRPRLYPIWGTTADELAVIGGPGVRLYFALLRLVASAFFLLAALMTAPIVINWLGDMYKMPAARDFVTDDYGADADTGMSPLGRTLWARTTLGALTRCDVAQQTPNNFADCDAPDSEASRTTSTRLVVYACLDLLATFIVLIVVRRVKRRKTELDELSDAAMISMSDYTVQLRPRGGYWRLPEKADAPMGQQQAFKESLRSHVEKHLGKVAMLASEESEQPELGIWLAYPEEHRIACWQKKVVLLKRLEHALGCLDGTHSIGCGRNKASAIAEAPVKPYATGYDDLAKVPAKTISLATNVSKLVMQLEKINEELEREEKNEVVCAFVAFEDERDQDKACNLVLKTKTKASAVHPEVEPNALHFAGRNFRIREAPEPDTIMFSHLQYSARKRTMRRSMATATLVGVLVGFMLLILKFRSLTTDTAFGTVCPAIEWDPSSDYAICDGAYAGNFSSEAQQHYKERWQYVKDAAGTKLPAVAKMVLTSSLHHETASCVLPNDGDCCTREHRTWAAAAEAECTRVWTVDAHHSFFPTTRGDGETGLRQCDIDRDCEAEPLPPDPGRAPGHRPVCGTMDCPTVVTAGASWEQHIVPEAAEWECVGGLDGACDPTSKTDLERCCTKKLEADMSKGHSVEAVCYHCICDCLAETSFNTEGSANYPNGCPSPASGWTDALIATYCAGDNGWDEWSFSVSIWSTLSSVITTTLNQVLKAGLEASSELEKPHTQAQEQSSLALKVAMAQFTNTVLLSMVSTMHLEGMLSFMSFSAYPFDGLTPWANARWYYQVGTSFMMTMAINQCLPPAIHAMKYFAFRFLQRLKVDKSSLSCGATTQSELNRIYELNEWKLASSYGEILFVLSSTLLLCTALPMLLWISAFGMTLKYWGDKTAVLRCYLKPPLYSSDLFEGLDTKLYFILSAHLVAATYFLSVAGGETPDEAYSPSGGRSISARSNVPFWFERGMLTQTHVFPLWISAVAMVSFPMARTCITAYKGNEYHLAQQRKKKLDAVKRRVQQAQRAMFETLKRRYALSDADVKQLAELVSDKDRAGETCLREALATVLREKANQATSSADEKFPVDDKTVGESVSEGVSHALDMIAHATAPLINGTKDAVHKADDIVHKSGVGKITDAVGHAGKVVIHNTAEGIAVAGKGLAMAATGAGAVAAKVVDGAEAVLQGVKHTSTTGRAVIRSLKLGHAYNEEDLDALHDDDLISGIGGSIIGLAMGDLMSDTEVVDPDATLPCFSVAYAQELLVNTRDHYDMDAASTLLDLQRSFRDTLYTIDPGAANRLQPQLASVPKEDAGGEKMTMQRMSLAIGVVNPHSGQPLTNSELIHSLRPEISDPGSRDGPQRGGKLLPIERKTPLFMAP